MRWWLALAFAAIAALTALSVAQVFTARSESKIRELAQELAAGSALTAALELSASEPNEIRSDAAQLGVSRQMALFVFDATGQLLSQERVRGISVTALPNFAELRDTALGGRRVVTTVEGGRLVTIALPLRSPHVAALVAVAPRSDLEDALGIVREEIVRAALLSVAIGAAVGLAIAALITRRLRRIASAAREIEQGRFDRELNPRFLDELGLLAGTIDDMRDRLREAFDRLEGEKDRLARLLEQLEEGVIAVDGDLVVEFANRQARALLGAEITPGRALADPWSRFSLVDALHSVFEPGASVQTLRVEPTPGTIYVIALLPPPAPSGAGVVVITDVTEVERRERAEREFVANAAHELRTPLAAIGSAVEALQLGAKEQPAERDRFLGVIERQTRRLTRLAHALLTLARAQTRSEPVKLETVELAPLLAEIVETLDARSVVVDVCCPDVAVRAHRELLHQALENLTTNALKHAPDGTLTLRVTHTSHRQVRIEVADEGPGMAGRDADRALDRFYRAGSSAGEGFGLGLAIVREVVGVMDGSVAISSMPGSGTTVSLVLEAACSAVSCR
ncbi:MAG TPA: ATP-binding protein [Gaiellaceae bacterium]|nr:ATP-binding protein [Gaiellaceae bacterium]